MPPLGATPAADTDSVYLPRDQRGAPAERSHVRVRHVEATPRSRQSFVDCTRLLRAAQTDQRAQTITALLEAVRHASLPVFRSRVRYGRADDLAQELVITVYRRYLEIVPATALGYLWRAVHNLVASEHNGFPRSAVPLLAGRAEPLEAAHDIPASDSPPDALERRELREQVRHIICGVAFSELRSVGYARYVLGETYQETVARLGIGYDTYRQRLRRFHDVARPQIEALQMENGSFRSRACRERPPAQATRE